MSPRYWPWCKSLERVDQIMTIIRVNDWKVPFDRYEWPQFAIFRFPPRRMRHRG